MAEQGHTSQSDSSILGTDHSTWEYLTSIIIILVAFLYIRGFGVMIHGTISCGVYRDDIGWVAYRNATQYELTIELYASSDLDVLR